MSARDKIKTAVQEVVQAVTGAPAAPPPDPDDEMVKCKARWPLRVQPDGPSLSWGEEVMVRRRDIPLTNGLIPVSEHTPAHRDTSDLQAAYQRRQIERHIERNADDLAASARATERREVQAAHRRLEAEQERMRAELRRAEQRERDLRLVAAHPEFAPRPQTPPPPPSNKPDLFDRLMEQDRARSEQDRANAEAKRRFHERNIAMFRAATNRGGDDNGGGGKAA